MRVLAVNPNQSAIRGLALRSHRQLIRGIQVGGGRLDKRGPKLKTGAHKTIYAIHQFYSNSVSDSIYQATTPTT